MMFFRLCLNDLSPVGFKSLPVMIIWNTWLEINQITFEENRIPPKVYALKSISFVDSLQQQS